MKGVENEMGFTELHYYKPERSKTKDRMKIKKDLIIYGGTVAGIMAALQAKKKGLSVAIVELGSHMGGMTTSGLGATDLGSEHAVGGLAKQFYNEIAAYYVKEKQWTFEPKVTQKVIRQWLKDHDIPVYLNQPLDFAEVEEKKITQIITENGSTFEASLFIDSTYEGDLMAQAGVSYTVGREAKDTYGEQYNGIQFGFPHHNFKKMIDPYVVPGDPSSGLLPLINEDDASLIGKSGEEDHRIQAYNFRICLTKDPNNRIGIPKPPNYDPWQFELLRRYIEAGIWDAMDLHTELPNGKTDLNNFGAISTDYIGMNYGWPEGTYEEREKIFQAHFEYNLGLLYFLANDPKVPETIRKEVSAWGLPKDEFVKTGHWPPQLYIREGRRMISDYVMTDQHCLGKKQAPDPIGVASYHMDSHHCRRIVVDGKCLNEGDVQIPIHPFHISYRSIRPKKEECENLLVPVCLSSSHIAYGAIRMEPVFMILGQAAGMAATIAFKQKQAVQDISYSDLKQQLLKEGQVITWPEDLEDDPVERMKKTFGKSARIE